MSMTLLEKLRLDQGLTRETLAERSGVPSRTVRELETGRIRNPRSDTLIKLGRELDVPASELALAFREGMAEVEPPAAA